METSRAASMARERRIAPRSKTVWDISTRASNTLKGPTSLGMVKLGTPVGKLNPSAPRLRVRFDSETFPVSRGKRKERATATRARAAETAASASWTEAAPRGEAARAMACRRLRRTGSCAHDREPRKSKKTREGAYFIVVYINQRFMP